MADFLLELFSEEIPARMQRQAALDLARLFTAALAEAGVSAEATETFVTPRRLALIAHGLPLATAAVSEERRGPRADAPAQAVEGFLKSTGLTRDQLEERDDPKGRFLYAVIEKPGQATADVIGRIVPAVIRDFPWPKSMRWGRGTLRWVRPLHSIVALLDGDVVPVEIDGIVAGRTTKGHRFLSSGTIEIGSAATYAEQLRDAHVILSSEDREAVIKAGAEAAATAAGLTLIEDAGLLAENAGLTEWPVPLLGAFDPAFLDVPPEVIQLTMRVNQKYFACADPATGKLAPAFVCVANTEASDGGEAIVAGNRKVLAARLSDAKFFWEQDRKTTLESRLPKLADIVFHEKLGTVADKVERVAKLARWLVESGAIKSSPAGGGGPRSGGGGASKASPVPVSAPSPPSFAGGPPAPAGADLATLAETAARLCKADLVTAMVGEFPELQGIMGGYYASAEGLDPQIAVAIRDHYKPVGQGDDVPTAPVTVAVSLADKLDTLFVLCGASERATGSRDPFGMRRQALGIIALLQTNRIRLNLFDCFEELAETFAAFARYDTLLLEGETPSELVVATWFESVRGISRGAEREMFVYYEIDTLDPRWREYELGFSNAERAREIRKQLGVPVDDDLAGVYSTFRSLNEISNELMVFFADRLKVQQREAGVRHDLIDAVFALGGEDDLVRLLARVKALQAFIATEDGTNLLAGYKRAANILRIEDKKDGPHAGEVARGLLVAPEEIGLADMLETVEAEARTAVEREDFAAAMASLAKLRPAVDAFFNAVTVNDAVPERRANRLNLLNRIRAAMHSVADFSKIEG